MSGIKTIPYNHTYSLSIPPLITKNPLDHLLHLGDLNMMEKVNCLYDYYAMLLG